MKAAVVEAAGQVPQFRDFAIQQSNPNELIIRVRASALSRLARARAAGKHYSSNAGYPFVAGVDGVGMLEDGTRVFFAFPKAPWGAMADQVVMPRDQCISLPDEIDDVHAAAVANPGMSSWMALRERANFVSGETVFINGATGSSGLLAVQIARRLGAKRVIATGRNPDVLRSLENLGATQVISLSDSDENQVAAFEDVFARGVDVVLDYLWGPSAQLILGATAKIEDPARPLRYVQIGGIAGDQISISAALMRSRANMIMGSGLGSVAPDRMMATLNDLFQSAGKQPYQLATETAPLSEISEAWSRDTGSRRLVLVL
ncbi:zinc-binding alcohol dehydrogenase family protein [Rhizobium leguminosarum]|uniref:quinone oxidoreductase family protein n=1 Tax=Rhizobium leguminosarum TaxID=384 RepID=UPI001C9672C9|nr:zinc-binding alcohol dehydrogenase family protein [Rhizobium leguminosarum]MBY5400972.1 zinc-binding alcohol dehydrogenase family protein [Rhizobium leguminosarum]